MPVTFMLQYNRIMGACARTITDRGNDPGKARANNMATISKEEARNTVNAWNARIAHFMQEELPALLEAEGVHVKNGKIKMNDWFKAQSVIERQCFYTQGHAIQMELRAAGHDVKMNMQDHTLVLY